MSVKIMGAVWDADLPQNEKLVLLAYADHANHDGSNVYPSINLVAWKTGYSRRSVQLITQKLKERDILISTDPPDDYIPTNCYKIAIENLPKRPPYKGGVKITPPTEGVQKLHGGDEISAQGGATHYTGGVQPITPKPSFNRNIKPSIETTTTSSRFGELVKAYEANIGAITQMTAEMLADDLEQYGLQLCLDAILEAVKQNKRKWSYVRGILKNWWADGRTGAEPKPGSKEKYKIVLPDGQIVEAKA